MAEFATSWATLAVVAALAADKMLTKCNMYPKGVKSLHCGISKCFEFDVARTSSSGPSTPIVGLSGVQLPSLPLQAPTPMEIGEFLETARRLSLDSTPAQIASAHS